MKIETAKLGHQELHSLIGTVISPLPIAFISTIGADGTHNAAPFSFIAPVCAKPAIICVSFGLIHGQKKDTLNNIESTRDFVINVVDEDLVRQAIKASNEYPPEVDEIKEMGLTAVQSDTVRSPRIAEAKINLECKLVQKLEILGEFMDGQGLRAIVLGEVVLAHIKDEILVNGEIDPSRLKVIGRVGNDTYCRTTDVFQLKR